MTGGSRGSAPHRRRHQLTAMFVTSSVLALAALSAATPVAQAADRVWMTSLPANISFSCEGRIAGYYADVDTGCQMYHMCDPQLRRYSYLCPALTAFDQFYMTCVHHQRVNCSTSKDFYHMNEMIGKPRMKFHSRHNQGTTVSKKKDTEGVEASNHVDIPSGQLLFEFETKLDRPAKRFRPRLRPRRPFSGSRATNVPAATERKTGAQTAPTSSDASAGRRAPSSTRRPLKSPQTSSKSRKPTARPTAAPRRPSLPKTLTGPALASAKPTVALAPAASSSVRGNSTGAHGLRMKPRVRASELRTAPTTPPAQRKPATTRPTLKSPTSPKPRQALPTRLTPRPNQTTTKSPQTGQRTRPSPRTTRRTTTTAKSVRRGVKPSSVAPRRTVVPPVPKVNQQLPQNTYKTVRGQPGSFSFGRDVMSKTDNEPGEAKPSTVSSGTSTEKPKATSPRTIPAPAVTPGGTTTKAPKQRPRQSTTARAGKVPAPAPRPSAAPTTPQTTAASAKTTRGSQRTATVPTTQQPTARAPTRSPTTGPKTTTRSRSTDQTTTARRATTLAAITRPPATTAQTTAETTAGSTTRRAATTDTVQLSTTEELTSEHPPETASPETDGTTPHSETDPDTETTEVEDTPIPVRVLLRGGQKVAPPDVDVEALKLSLTLQLPRIVEESDGPREHVDMKVRGELITGEMALRKLMVDQLKPTYFPSPSVPLNLLPPLMSQQRLPDGSSTTTLALPFRSGRPTGIQIQTGSPEDGSLQTLDWLLPPAGQTLTLEPPSAPSTEKTTVAPSPPAAAAPPSPRRRPSQEPKKDSDKLTMKFGKTKKSFHTSHSHGSKDDPCYPCMKAFMTDVASCHPCVVIR